MSIKIKLGLILSVAVLLGAGCAAAPGAQKAEDKARVQAEEARQKAVNTAQNSMVVEITEGGFFPAELTISAGTTVLFINKDKAPRWPASGVHPTHEICKGFDAGKPLASGETYSYTFKEVKVCPMHDHLNPGTKGQITVIEK